MSVTISGSVIVTGCSSGIGRACAEEMYRNGVDVIAACRTEGQADELRRLGMKAMALDNDLASQIKERWEEAKRLADGRIWGVFANAGYGQPGALEDVTWEAMEAQLRTNVVGTQELLRCAIRDMRMWGGGRLVICSSVLGVVAMRNRGAYVASKFALEGIADTYRIELEGSGVHVSLLEPGPVLTKFRPNGHKMFKRYIDAGSSVHREMYERLEKRLLVEGPIVPFTADAKESYKLVMHAMCSTRPRHRYKWTVQTKVFTALKRLLPTRVMDAIASRG